MVPLVMSIFAIISALGGSYSISCKNLCEFGGHPLISWSIRDALDSQEVDRSIVSTNDHEIAVIAKDHGAETPFLRPVEFAQDNTPDRPLFLHT